MISVSVSSIAVTVSAVAEGSSFTGVIGSVIVAAALVSTPLFAVPASSSTWKSKLRSVTESAAVIWKNCDGEHSLEEIADALEAGYDAPRETIVSDLNGLLEDLKSKGLLDTPAAE